MHLLYLDDSGSTNDPDQDYIVLGGVSVYEAQIHYLTEKLDELAASIDGSDPHSVEFHASEIFSRRTHPWKDMHRDEARGVIKAVLQVLAEAFDTARAFACAIHKPSHIEGDPIEYAFEDLCNRFDIYLTRRAAEGQRDRGLVILDRSADETALRQLARDFRLTGTRWRSLRKVTETPLFCDSKASRIVQLADHVAYAVYRYYEAEDAQYFNIIASQFHEADGVIHGLNHRHPNHRVCMCPACITRR